MVVEQEAKAQAKEGEGGGKSSGRGTIARDDYFMSLMKEQFHSQSSVFEKIQQVVTILVTMVTLIVPQELPIALGLVKKRQNIGRLQTIIPNQIYQQNYFNGQTNSTIFKSRDGKSLLIYISARLTPEYLDDLAALNATVKYIIVSNECHDSYAYDCKKQFPNAKVITPEVSRKMVEEAVHVDHTL